VNRIRENINNRIQLEGGAIQSEGDAIQVQGAAAMMAVLVQNEKQPTKKRKNGQQT
jgi:hypothetical protein